MGSGRPRKRSKKAVAAEEAASAAAAAAAGDPGAAVGVGDPGAAAGGVPGQVPPASMQPNPMTAQLLFMQQMMMMPQGMGGKV